MPIVERETVIEPARSETVVVDRGGSSIGLIGGIVGALLLVAVVFWAANGGIGGGGGAVNVDLPEVTVTD